MTHGLYSITPSDLRTLLHDPDRDLISYARSSSPLLAGLYGDGLVCIIGLVPESFLSARAYIWLHVGEYAGNVKLVPLSMRHVKEFVIDSLDRYPTIFGHCNTPTSIRWWTKLGAKLTHLDGNIHLFEISK